MFLFSRSAKKVLDRGCEGGGGVGSGGGGLKWVGTCRITANTFLWTA